MTNNELYHHGIKGQRWGIRRYQNPDGTLTPVGRQRYGIKGTLEDHSARNFYDLGKQLQDTNEIKLGVRHLRGYVQEYDEAYRKVRKTETDFYRNEKLYDECCRKAFDKNLKAGLKLGDMTYDEGLEWFKNEMDGMSDEGNAIDYLYQTNHPLGKKLKAQYKKLDSAFNNYMSESKKNSR